MKKNKKNKKQTRAYFKLMKRRRSYPDYINTISDNFQYSMNWNYKKSDTITEAKPSESDKK